MVLFDGESLGLYFFDLDLRDIADNLPDEDVEFELAKYHLNKQELLTLRRWFSLFLKILQQLIMLNLH